MSEGERRPVKGGSSVVAAMIRSTKEQGRSLQDLGRGQVPREIRIERALSTMEGQANPGN